MKNDVIVFLHPLPERARYVVVCNLKISTLPISRFFICHPLAFFAKLLRYPVKLIKPVKSIVAPYSDLMSLMSLSRNDFRRSVPIGGV